MDMLLPESSYDTIVDEEGTSIHYKDLYIINGRICFKASSHIELPYVNKWTNTYGWKPEIIKSVPIVTVEINISVYSDMIWISNIGHALFDGLYPIYLALVKFKLDDVPFDIITNKWDNFREKSTQVIQSFSRGDIIELNNNPNVYHIKHLIVGTGRTGNRVIKEDYTLSGKKYNGISLFKKRMLSTFDAQWDTPVNNSPNITIVDNKRFSKEEIIVMNKAIEILRGERYNIEYIYWQKFPSYREQMQKVADTDIYVSAPGNAIMYTPFLKKGGVVINLGWIEHTQTNTMRPNLVIPNASKSDYILPGFMEQSICAASEVSTLYYDRYTYNNIELDSFLSILRKSIAVSQGTEVPISNHNIDAMIFMEYCKRVNNGRQIADHLTNVALFIEFFVNEHPQAIPKNLVDIDLLRRIKDEYGFNRSYEIVI